VGVCCWLLWRFFVWWVGVVLLWCVFSPCLGVIWCGWWLLTRKLFSCRVLVVWDSIFTFGCWVFSLAGAFAVGGCLVVWWDFGVFRLGFVLVHGVGSCFVIA